MVAGFAVYGVIVPVVAQIMRAQTGVVIDPFKFSRIMLWAPAGLILMGALAGVLPAIKAYRTAVAENLAPLS
jgi:putative ABC transport system permease protein